MGRWSFLLFVLAAVAGTILLHASRGPTGPRGYYNRGVADGRAGHFDRAIENLDRSIALDPANADAYVARAVVWQRSRHPFRALVDVDAALDRAPESSRAFYVRGIAHRVIGREEAALRDFETALSFDRGFARAALARAGVLLDGLRYDEALEAARRAWEVRRLDSGTNHAPFIVWAARTLGGDPAGADRELAARGIDVVPKGVGDWMEGVRLQARGDLALALERFRSATLEKGLEDWTYERAHAAAENLVLGFRAELVNREISDSMSFGPGMRVTCVRPGGAAEAAGLRAGDRLLLVEGREPSAEALHVLVLEAPWDGAIAWEGLRKGEPIRGEIRPASSSPTR